MASSSNFDDDYYRLHEQLRDLFEQELHIWAINEEILNIRNLISSTKPSQKPDRSRMRLTYSFWLSKKVIMGCLAVFALFAAFTLLGISMCSADPEMYPLRDDNGSLTSNMVLILVFGCAAVLALIILFFLYLHDKNVNRLIDEDYKKQQKQYEKEMNEHNSKIRYLNGVIDYLSKLQQVSQTLLISMYSKSPIHVKYRNLLSIGTIYEYLDTKRCYRLEDDNGAYNMFEQEVRMNMLLIGIKDILTKMEELRKNQILIYNAIIELSDTIKNMHSDLIGVLSDISESSQQTANASSISAFANVVNAYNSTMKSKYNV